MWGIGAVLVFYRGLCPLGEVPAVLSSRADVLLGAGGPAMPSQAGSRAAGVLLSWAKSCVWQTACGAGPSW